MRRTLVLALCAGVLAGLGAITMSTPVKAECPYIPPYPPVTEATRSAREIIVGTVLEDVGGQIYDLRLRIDYVLRGSSNVGDIRRVKFLYPNWPLAKLDDGTMLAPCEAITASPGNVIALAYDALANDGRTRYNAVSWISGKSEYRDEDRFETTTLAKLQALADLPQTDAAPTPPRASDPPDADRFDAALLLAVALMSALLVVVRLNGRDARLGR